jgi:uncharacterized Tic20 family protein
MGNMNTHPAFVPSLSAQEKRLVALMHASILVGILIPIAGFLIPFIIWIVKKDESSFVESQGKEIFNFIINFILASVAFGLLSFLLVGLPFLVALGLYGIITPIIAAIQSSDGKAYRYPWLIHFL